MHVGRTSQQILLVIPRIRSSTIESRMIDRLTRLDSTHLLSKRIHTQSGEGSACTIARSFFESFEPPLEKTLWSLGVVVVLLVRLVLSEVGLR